MSHKKILIFLDMIYICIITLLLHIHPSLHINYLFLQNGLSRHSDGRVDSWLNLSCGKVAKVCAAELFRLGMNKQTNRWMRMMFELEAKCWECVKHKSLSITWSHWGLGAARAQYGCPMTHCSCVPPTKNTIKCHNMTQNTISTDVQCKHGWWRYHFLYNWERVYLSEHTHTRDSRCCRGGWKRSGLDLDWPHPPRKNTKQTHKPLASRL